METTDISRSFVVLAAKHDWLKVTELPAEEVQILFNVVAAAGFEPKEVIPGNLVGHEREQGGGETDETYLINTLCPYKVVGQDGSDDCPATGWLDSILKSVLAIFHEKFPSTWGWVDLVEAVYGEIERSIPLKPIRLTPEGEKLREYPPHRGYPRLGNYFVDHTRDGHELNYNSLGVGVHARCGGLVCRVDVTETLDALVCKVCNLRVLFPKLTKTYGELRTFLASTFVQVGVR